MLNLSPGFERREHSSGLCFTPMRNLASEGRFSLATAGVKAIAAAASTASRVDKTRILLFVFRSMQTAKSKLQFRIANLETAAISLADQRPEIEIMFQGLPKPHKKLPPTQHQKAIPASNHIESEHTFLRSCS